MTAEIAIMNKTAVALAADSAVTIGLTRSGRPANNKIFNTVNKLFALSKYQPLGVMIYGSSELNAVPWELLIKEFRRHLGRRSLPHVDDYVEAFVEFLRRGGYYLVSEENQRLHLERLVRGHFRKIRDEIKSVVENHIKVNQSITDSEVASVVRNALEAQAGSLEASDRLSSWTPEDELALLRRHGARMLDVAKEELEQLPLDTACLDAMRRISTCVASRNHVVGTPSGVVVAGFGRNDSFPVLVELQIEMIVDSRLRYRALKRQAIDPTHTAAAIIPFAQSEMVTAFMEGIDPFYARMLQGYLGALLKDFAQVVEDNALTLPEESREPLRRCLEGKGQAAIDNLKKHMQDFQWERLISPVMQIVQSLPKDELASMAEALVNLTSFRRRVSTDAETVGGPVDVAIISKGDGFIWIRRKHYFDGATNPQFLANYYREEQTTGGMA